MSHPVSHPRQRLIGILQRAYSGELAAAFAYRGHWRSLREPGARAQVRRIEEEEWRHREIVGGMLRALAVRPCPYRERQAQLVGRTLGPLCHVSGWLLPMYAAGWLERSNVLEYEQAAWLAGECGRSDFVDALLEMARVEWDHERYFRSQVESHPWGRRLPLWPAPGSQMQVGTQDGAERPGHAIEDFEVCRGFVRGCRSASPVLGDVEVDRAPEPARRVDQGATVTGGLVASRLKPPFANRRTS